MTVFVVQKQMKYDPAKEAFVPKFELESAHKYGKLEYLLSPTAQPFNPWAIIDELHEKLKHITANDHLLLIGNPCLIGMVVAIAACYTQGKVRMLQWSGKEQKYVEVIATLYDCGDPKGQ